MSPENAVYLTGPKQLESLNGYSRIYYGAEFCETLLPAEKEFLRVVDFANENSLGFSLLTPFLTDSGMKRIDKLLTILSKNHAEAEVIVNDWGLLRRVNNLNLKPVMGRLINKQQRGPRTILLKGAPEGMFEHYSRGIADSEEMQNFLLENNIFRIELDNLLQGVGSDFSKTKLKASLHYPFAFISTSRLCLAANCESLLGRKKIDLGSCSRECERYLFKLKSKDMPVELLLKGNSYFFENKKIPENLAAQGIDRIVKKDSL